MDSVFPFLGSAIELSMPVINIQRQTRRDVAVVVDELKSESSVQQQGTENL